jgi:hypothetical protein
LRIECGHGGIEGRRLQMVLRASPVMFETAARPPHLAARLARCNNRRPRRAIQSRFTYRCGCKKRLARYEGCARLRLKSAIQAFDEARNSPSD